MIAKFVDKKPFKKFFVFEKNYIIYEISYHKVNDNFMITVSTEDENDPSYEKLDFFEIVDESVPSNYIFKYYDKKNFNFYPKEFGGDFWERFHDGDEQAQVTFEKVDRELRLFHGWKVKRLPEDDIVEKVLRKCPKLSQSYIICLGCDADEYKPPISLLKKSQCLLQSIKEQLQTNTLQPETLLDLLYTIEDEIILMSRSQEQEIKDVNFLQNLRKIIEDLKQDCSNYRYVDLYKDNIGLNTKRLSN